MPQSEHIELETDVCPAPASTRALVLEKGWKTSVTQLGKTRGGTASKVRPAYVCVLKHHLCVAKMPQSEHIELETDVCPAPASTRALVLEKGWKTSVTQLGKTRGGTASKVRPACVCVLKHHLCVAKMPQSEHIELETDVCPAPASTRALVLEKGWKTSVTQLGKTRGGTASKVRPACVCVLKHHLCVAKMPQSEHIELETDVCPAPASTRALVLEKR